MKSITYSNLRTAYGLDQAAGYTAGYTDGEHFPCEPRDTPYLSAGAAGIQADLEESDAA